MLNKHTLLVLVKGDLINTSTQGHVTDVGSACGALESARGDMDIRVPGLAENVGPSI